MTLHMLGIDIAKSSFQLHGADSAGKAVLKKCLPRHKLAACIANLPACIVVMESCGGANYCARAFQRNGHTVKLISPQFVKSCVRTNKNDANDALANVEAASRSSMNFVPIKRAEQQDIRSIHRILVAGMTIGTVFTLFLPPSVYLVLAPGHRKAEQESGGTPINQQLLGR